MKRFRILTGITFVLGIAAAAGAWGVRAQSPQTAPMPAMDHMMHGQAAPEHQHMHGMTPPAGQISPSQKSDDARTLVALPAAMQEHMLANMRDHLATLNTVMGDVADGKFDLASKLLEERLGMSSLSLHHAAEMAPYFPQPMQEAGTAMHHAASRLAIVLQDASVAQTFDSMREVNGALHEVTSACVACHSGYRLR